MSWTHRLQAVLSHQASYELGPHQCRRQMHHIPAQLAIGDYNELMALLTSIFIWTVGRPFLDQRTTAIPHHCSVAYTVVPGELIDLAKLSIIGNQPKVRFEFSHVSWWRFITYGTNLLW